MRSQRKMTMEEFEGSAADKEADRKALAEINRRRVGAKEAKEVAHGYGR